MTKLIVGLGNPGRAYTRSRHNAGFICLDAFAHAQGLSFSRRRDHAQLAQGEVDGLPLLLAKPLTYMNQSGRAVAALMHWQRLSRSDLVVIHDDLDMPLGQLRLRPGGSAAGHHGLESIISALGSREFIRIRVGIGRGEGDPVRYVLSAFSAQEKEVLKLVVAGVSQALLCLLGEGLEMAMNRFNRQDWQVSA